ncbi:putative ABC transport system ATP-binding protein [Frankia sp. AiPs1]|uniref:ATP-binding cassette domain-containing protein n=1 Tax=Frankia sp. AiPa1 TaxID=573492 RepID=UPI00202B062F|nr:ATP-binding cassette domain-containing protein [Frankia sp. AiPa1]MCL9760836.1 ATP-binding cassette domain-containing protein [Frankia sp. AiPa1]
MARRTGASPGGRREAATSDIATTGRRHGRGTGGAPGVPAAPSGGGQRSADESRATPVAAARASQLTKVYGSGDTIVTALRGIDIGFPRGRFTAIMGPSGSGKSTLMHCLAGLDSITRGRVYIGDVDLSRLSDKELTRLRRDRIGFIFQQFNLLPTLTAAENITLPLSIAGRSPDKEWMRTVVDAVGLAPRLRHRPTELSGGQQQRVACARALVTRPDIIFADEPTGNLDSRSGAEVLQFLRDSVTELGQTIVMVTHDATAASYSDEVIFLADGRLVDSLAQPTADEVLDRLKHLDAVQRGLVVNPATEERSLAAVADGYSQAAADYGPNPAGYAPSQPAYDREPAGDRARDGHAHDDRGRGSRAREAEGYSGAGYGAGGRVPEGYAADGYGERGAEGYYPADGTGYDHAAGGFGADGYGGPATGGYPADGYGEPATGGYPADGYGGPATGAYTRGPDSGYGERDDAGAYRARPAGYEPGPAAGSHGSGNDGSDGHRGVDTGGYPYPDQRYAHGDPSGDHERGYADEDAGGEPGGAEPHGQIGDLYRDSGRRRRRSGGSHSAEWA